MRVWLLSLAWYSVSGMSVRGGLRVLEWIPSQQVLVKSAKFVWHETWRTMMAELAPQSAAGDYVRPAPQTGTAPVALTEAAYTLYVGNACPWCHRAVVATRLREATNVNVIELSDDAAKASRGGWILKDGDPVFGASDLKQVYDRATGGAYRGRCTAPLLVDSTRKRIVARDSADIARALCEQTVRGANDVDLRPAALAADIDAMCAFVYENVNDGVYKCGFCTTQEAYERAEAALHNALAEVDRTLANSRFLCADKLTLADVWLYPTIARFDSIYAPLFRCGRRRIADYPHISRWFADLATLLAPTFDLPSAAASYFSSLFPLNPSGIVPALVAAPAVLSTTTLPLDDDLAFKFVK